MVSIQVMSDLHLEAFKEYDTFMIPPKAPYLALLGDIGNIAKHKRECLAFLEEQLLQYRTVLFVPGNHETYDSSWPATLKVLREFEANVQERRNKAGGSTKLGQFVLLDRTTFELESSSRDVIVVLGCSLFSYVPPERAVAVEMGLRDFMVTEEWDVLKHNEAHAQDVAWLNQEVARLQQLDKTVKIIVFSHWSPSTDIRSVEPVHVNSPIGSGFSTDLSGQPCFTSDNVVLWASGHTHHNYDFACERKGSKPVRLMTNQRGYYHAQAPGFDIGKVVRVP